MMPEPPRARRLAGAALVLAALGGLLSPDASAAFRYLQEGMTGPELSGTDVRTGEKVSTDMSSMEPDAILVVTFWATWSPRSLEILADLKRMTEEYQGRPFHVIAVNVDGGEMTKAVRDEIRRIVTELDLPFPVIIDADLTMFDTYGVVAVPSTAVLDTGGILKYAPAGYSYTIRDRLVDSTRVMLGLKDRAELVDLDLGYVPDVTASRYYNLAVRMTRERMYERALGHLDKAQEADVKFSAPANLRGQILLALGKPDEAAIQFEHAVGLNDSSVAAWAGWGRALLLTGDREGAREKLEAALALDEFYAEAMIDLASCLLPEGEEAALQLLESARELNPRNPAPYLVLGRHHESAGRSVDALASYRSALEILHPAP